MRPPIAEFIDAYAVLGVRPDAGQEELKAAHRRLVRRHHPDLVPPAERAEATRRVKEVNVAYGLVRDPETRSSYDRLRKQVRTREAAANLDQALAAQWEALSVSAGRWAAGWWRRSRRRLGRAARRTNRAGLGVVGRVVWLLYSAAGAVAGVAVAFAAQRLLGIEGDVAPVTGLITGALAGSQRGWQRRLRLAGFSVQPAARAIGTVLAAAVLATALWVDAVLAG